ncbi:MAG: hypothetical protein P9L99_14775 [Candidatus Lernaella stagnicola]|nr:hypothetical protein [Candidatus Lernaella stagnicola]
MTSRYGYAGAMLSSGKKIVFALLVLAAVAVVGTVILTWLERGGYIASERVDDRVQHPPVHLLEKRGDTWVIGGVDMLTGTLPAVKDARSFRILAIGGSFLMGFPYTKPGMAMPGEAGIPHWLQLELTQRYPSRRFEVLNLSAAGQDSTRCLKVLKAFLAVEPDLVVVGTGNNEGSLPPSRFNEALHEWIAYRLLKKALLRPPDFAARPLFTPQDPDLRKIEDNFENNVRAVVALCAEARVPLVMLTMPINLRYGGLDSRGHDSPTPEPVLDEWMRKGRRLQEKKKWNEAIEAFAKSRNQAAGAYLIAQCYEKLERHEQAREFYRLVAQINPLTRTRPSYNAFIRQLAGDGGFTLVDLERILERRSAYGIPNPELFLDYCHLKWWAYLLLSQPVSRSIAASGVIPPSDREPRPAPSALELIRAGGLAPDLMNKPESADFDKFQQAWETADETLPTALDPLTVFPPVL